MKNLKALALAILALAVLVPAAFAQTGSVKTFVPFGFYALDKWMPAGIYETRSMPNGLPVIRLSNLKGETVYLSVRPLNNEPKGQSRLVFNRYGDEMFLSEVYWTGGESGKSLVRSKHELELQAESKVTRVAVKSRQ